MPYFNLAVGSKILSAVASSRAEALEIFGSAIGEALTFENQGCVAQHMLDEWTNGPHGVNPHVPIWVKPKRQGSNPVFTRRDAS
jgi:hypothetical protein